MDIRARLGKRVRHLREAAGLSQERLAHRARMSRVFLGDIEKGDKSVSIDTLEKLARALDVSMATLLEDVHDATPRTPASIQLDALLDGAPPAEVTRFLAIAEAFFLPYQVRRRRRSKPSR